MFQGEYFLEREKEMQFQFLNARLRLFVLGNGLIDFKEFLVLMNNFNRSNIEEETKVLFTQIDLNHDGFITKNELKIMMKNLGEKVRKKDIRKMIKEADLNKDGKISFSGKVLLL